MEKSVLIFLPDSLQPGGVGFLEGFCGKCEDAQVFFVLSEKLKNSSSVDSIGYVSAVSPENGKVQNCRNPAEWLHINSNTGEIKIYKNDIDGEYCMTCIRYDHRLFVQSEAVLLESRNYGIYFETLIRLIKKKYCEKMPTMFGLTFFILKLCGIITNFFSEVNIFHLFLKQMNIKRKQNICFLNLFCMKLIIKYRNDQISIRFLFYISTLFNCF